MSDWKSIHLDDPSMWPTDVIVPLEASHDDRGSSSLCMTYRQKVLSLFLQ